MPNVVVPILEGVFLTLANYEWIVEQQDKASKWVNVGLNFTTVGVGVSLVVSGLVLIWSIWSIRSFLKS